MSALQSFPRRRESIVALVDFRLRGNDGADVYFAERLLLRSKIHFWR